MDTKNQKSGSQSTQEDFNKMGFGVKPQGQPQVIRHEFVRIETIIYDNGFREVKIGVGSEIEGKPVVMNDDELKGLLINAIMESTISRNMQGLPAIISSEVKAQISLLGNKSNENQGN